MGIHHRAAREAHTWQLFTKASEVLALIRAWHSISAEKVLVVTRLQSSNDRALQRNIFVAWLYFGAYKTMLMMRAIDAQLVAESLQPPDTTFYMALAGIRACALAISDDQPFLQCGSQEGDG